MENSNRNRNIDFFKGFLIILVIAGHFFPKGLKENAVKYVIYAFHMPLFFFVGGYLINLDKICNENWKKTLFRYAKRMVIPWLLAIQIYYMINCLVDSTTACSVRSYVRQYAMPYYHLWYVPGFLFCVLMTLIIFKIVGKNENGIRFFLAIGLLAVSMYIIRKSKGVDFPLIRLIEHTIRPQHLFFFGLGIYNKHVAISGGGTFNG